MGLVRLKLLGESTRHGRMPKDFYEKRKALAKTLGINTSEAIMVCDRVLKELINEVYVSCGKKGKKKKKMMGLK